MNKATNFNKNIDNEFLIYLGEEQNLPKLNL